MRLSRKVSVLLALSLLTSATTANAECAWVLWWETLSRRRVARRGRFPNPGTVYGWSRQPREGSFW